jgi:O-antigen ligase
VVLYNDIVKIINNDIHAGLAGTGRWRRWTHTVQYIGERPFFGWGSEGIFDLLKEETGGSRPHNEYLQYAAFFGIPAALCYIAGVVSVFVKGIKKRAEIDIYTFAALVASFGYLVSALFGNTMSYTAPYFFIMLGLAVRPCRDISPCRPIDHKPD